MAIVFLWCLLHLTLLTNAFEHPGLLVSDSDITRIKSKLDSQLDPWKSSWEKLTSLSLSQPGYKSGAVPAVSRDASGSTPANSELLWHDATAAFNLGLRWRIEGKAEYADAASKILTDWSEALRTIGDTDNHYLLAGLQGYELVNAAELIRDYEPFASNGLETFSAMFTKVFLSQNLDFLNHRAGSEHNHQHFFANWELCNMASAMAFGVLTENQTLFDFVVEYFKTGTGNGAINLGVSHLVEEPGSGVVLGQPQEAGRDQGHTGMDVQLWAVVGQQAWNQHVDLFGYNNSRILQGIEYYARYNLGNDIPFEPYTNGIVSYTSIGAGSRGALRPTWELLHAHYAQIKGQSAPWTERYRNYTLDAMGGFEGGAGSLGEGSGHYDGLGWGSLLYRLEDSDVKDLQNNYTERSTTLPVSSKITTATSASTVPSAATTTSSLPRVTSSAYQADTSTQLSSSAPSATSSAFVNASTSGSSPVSSKVATAYSTAAQHNHWSHHHSHKFETIPQVAEDSCESGY